MRSFREYLTEAMLFEANVANVDAIDQFVGAYMRKTKLPQGKAWLKKKLRTYLLNQPEFLTPIDPNNVPAELPDYAVQAIQRGEPVFLFDPQGKVRGIAQQIQHIVDWFDAMHATVEAGADAMNSTATNDFRLTQKEVEKLQKITFDQATPAADAWFAHMGTRLRGQKKEMTGVEIVMTWQDGYYAVRYTDSQVMRMDGRDLQNCLQHGNYWNQVANGSNQVFGIRKPNDEAVVGMRTSLKRSQPAFSEPGKPKVQNWELEECKGKANKPPAPQYIPYVIEFLKQAQNIDIEGSVDLEKAGVYYRNGEFGTFDDIAEVIYNQGNIKILRTDDKMRASIGNLYISGNIANNRLTYVDSDGVPAETTAKLLQLSDLPPAPNFVKTLRNANIFYQDGKYGTAKDVGKHLGTTDLGMDVYAVEGRVFGFSEDEVIASFSVDDGKVSAISSGGDDDDNFDDQNVGLNEIQMLNLTGLPPTKQVEENFSGDIWWNGESYGRIAKVGQKVGDVRDYEIYRLGKRASWVAVDTSSRSFTQLIVIAGVLELMRTEFSSGDAGAVMRWLALNYSKLMKKVANGQSFGILNLKGGTVVADKATFFANLPKFHEYAQDTSSESIQYAINSPVRSAIVKALKGYVEDSGQPLSRQETAALIEAFRPDPAAPLRVTEEKEIKLHDILIKRPIFLFPQMVPLMFHAMGAKVPKEAVADMKLAMKQVVQYLKKNPHVNAEVNLNFRRSGQGLTSDVTAYCGLDKDINKLMDMIADHKTTSQTARQDRMDNFDKYADNNISNRFAALNAMNKLKGK